VGTAMHHQYDGSSSIVIHGNPISSPPEKERGCILA
jgi:hypothetical protein